MTQAEFDAQSERVNQRLLEEGSGDDGLPPRHRPVEAEVRQAYQTLEAIEVRKGDEVVGYWTSYFVPVEDFPAEMQRAKAVIAADAEAAG